MKQTMVMYCCARSLGTGVRSAVDLLTRARCAASMKTRLSTLGRRGSDLDINRLQFCVVAVERVGAAAETRLARSSWSLSGATGFLYF